VAWAIWTLGNLRPLGFAVLVAAVTWFLLELLPPPRSSLSGTRSAERD
jgi:hypothetical protein